MPINKPITLTREDRQRYEYSLLVEPSHMGSRLTRSQAESIVHLLPEVLPPSMAFLLEIVHPLLYSNASPSLQEHMGPYQWAVRLSAPNTGKMFHIETVSEFFAIRNMLDMLKSISGKGDTHGKAQ